MTFNPSQGDGAQLIDVIQLQATLSGYSLVDASEAAVTPGTSDLTVDVAGAPSGVRLGGPAESFGGATGVSLPTPDPTDPRKALVYLDSNGTVQTLGGDPAPADPSGAVRESTGVPTVPIPNEDFLPLAEVWLEAGATDIVSGDIQSRRVPAGDIQPIQVTDEAVSFAESDVFVKTTNTEVLDGSIVLSTSETSGSATVIWPQRTAVDSWDVATYQRTLDGESVTVDVLSQTDGTTLSLPEDNGSFDTSDAAGLVIEPQTDLVGITCRISAQTSGASVLYLDSDIAPPDGDVSQKDISTFGSGDLVTIYGELTSGNEYLLSLDDGGNSYTSGFNNDVTTPITSSDIDINNGYLEGSVQEDVVRAFEDLTPLTTTTELTDIDRNTPINSISPDENAVIKANIDRTDTGNTPSLDYAARRLNR